MRQLLQCLCALCILTVNGSALLAADMSEANRWLFIFPAPNECLETLPPSHENKKSEIFHFFGLGFDKSATT